MPPNRFESEVGNFLEGSHGDRTHIKRADHHTVTPLCGTLLFAHVRSHRANFFAPRAQGRHNSETNGITKRPPRYIILPTTTVAHPWRYKTLPTTTVAHPWRYKTLPAREKNGCFYPKCISRENFVPLAEHRSRAGRILYRSQSTEAEQGEFCTGHRGLTPPRPITSQSPRPLLRGTG